MNPFSDELIKTLVQRELDKQSMQIPASEYNPPKPDPMQMEPLSPGKAALFGGAMDIAGTYAGMKTGKGKEGNPLVTKFGNQSPEKTGLTLLAGLAGTRAAAGLIGKLSPTIGNALSANLGAQQMALGSNWLEKLTGRKHARRTTGSGRYQNANQRWLAEQQRRGNK